MADRPATIGAPTYADDRHRAPGVVFVVDELANNGAVHITVDLARRWAPGGTLLAVLRRLPDPGAELAVPPGCDVRFLTAPGRRLRSGLGRAVPDLLRTSRRRTAVLAASEIGTGLLLGFLAARATRRPFVVAVHADLDDALTEWIPGRLHRLTRWVHRHADGAICVAPALADPLRRNGLDDSRIAVVRNGIDLDAVRRAAAGPESLVDKDVPAIVATGRLAPQKAYDNLIRAHALVVGDRPHRVLLLNDGPERETLQALARELEVADTVVFAGAIPSPLPSVAAASAFCLPSRHEGLPLALLEAVAIGVPCIVTDSSPGVRDALDGGRVGDLLPVDDVPALAAALRAHLTDPEPLRRKAALGPRYARQFDRAAMADAWADAIDRFVLGWQHRRAAGGLRRRRSR